MKLKPIVLSLFLAGGLCACATSAPPRYVSSRAGVEVVVRPPAPKVVIVPAARSGYVWAPGYWRWNGRDHVWVEGQYLRERRGERWVPAHWEERGDHWRFEEGHWER